MLTLVLLALATDAHGQAQPCAPGANCSEGQSGGNSYGTLNVYGPPILNLSDDRIAQLVQRTPKDFPVQVWAVGPDMDDALADARKLDDAFKNAGFNVTLNVAGDVSGIYHQITYAFGKDGSTWWIKPDGRP